MPQPAHPTDRFIWALPVTTTQTYDVYARWPADPTHATNAPYTVHYAGGTTSVTMNQTQNGGDWNLLGTFTLDPALNPKVVLSDQANGVVVADAVLVVPSGTGSDRVTYTPTLASAETVDIYAKWTETGTRAQEVTYTIHHSGGSSDILVNQQQPSAGWYHLGVYTMSPGQNHRVEVYGALEGETVADAIRFVSSGVSAPGINYVHADHLGSPQKMTDSAKTVVWDAVYTPFGQVHSIAGTATNNQRFPGQYADVETGYSYNYFRDYDPTTGRYVQSDPIGLRGGTNTYLYGNAIPFKFIDPKGLFGTKSCSYYDQACGANEGLYECNFAPSLCRAFPDNDDPTGDSDKIGNWSECVRQCLQEKHKNRMPLPNQCSEENNIKPQDNFDDHRSCWKGCLLNPENPYNPSGPNLSDGSPRLY